LGLDPAGVDQCNDSGHLAATGLDVVGQIGKGAAQKGHVVDQGVGGARSDGSDGPIEWGRSIRGSMGLAPVWNRREAWTISVSTAPCNTLTQALASIRKMALSPVAYRA
jgi:hypothetical protein